MCYPWMDQGCQSNSVIHGYSDRGWQVECMAIHGWTRDVRVTLSSLDGMMYGDPWMDEGCQEFTHTYTVLYSLTGTSIKIEL